MPNTKIIALNFLILEKYTLTSLISLLEWSLYRYLYFSWKKVKKGKHAELDDTTPGRGDFFFWFIIINTHTHMHTTTNLKSCENGSYLCTCSVGRNTPMYVLLLTQRASVLKVLNASFTILKGRGEPKGNLCLSRRISEGDTLILSHLILLKAKQP